MSSDSDIGAAFEAKRKFSQEKRASNRRNGAEILRDHEVPFESRNEGAHLIVSHGGKVVDFWPGTGLWQHRGGSNGRGAHKLTRYLGILTKNQAQNGAAK